MPDDMDSHPINEWIAGELARIKEQLMASERNLQNLIEHHRIVVDNYASVCRYNDRMRAAGDELVNLIHEYPGLGPEFDLLQWSIDEAIKKWNEANV